MSRIHEALVQAEQEQNGGPGASVSTVPRPVDISVLLQPENPAAVMSELNIGADEITSDSLLSRASRPAWKPANGNMLFLQPDIETTPWAEQFRAFRSRLYRLRQKQPLKIILVTSSLPQEGKSFVSANLSQIFAQQRGCRTLLIDADLRWSRLHEYLGAPCSPGLPDYLAGTVDEFPIVQRSPVPELFFVPGGPARSPAELISNGRIKQLLDKLEPLFDWIVIDSPPASVVSDVAVLAGVSHGVVLVVRSGFTSFGVAQKARDELKDHCMLGVVLNAAPENGNLGAYYYYGGHQANSHDGNNTRHERR